MCPWYNGITNDPFCLGRGGVKKFGIVVGTNVDELKRFFFYVFSTIKLYSSIEGPKFLFTANFSAKSDNLLLSIGL